MRCSRLFQTRRPWRQGLRFGQLRTLYKQVRVLSRCVLSFRIQYFSIFDKLRAAFERLSNGSVLHFTLIRIDFMFSILSRSMCRA